MNSFFKINASTPGDASVGGIVMLGNALVFNNSKAYIYINQSNSNMGNVGGIVAVADSQLSIVNSDFVVYLHLSETAG